jgi:WhiB family redox-sensing transcriptional regulator
MKKGLVPLPKWKDGVCRTMDPDIFFMDTDDKADLPNALALFACQRCDIQSACLHWAMEQNEKSGIWGGTTPRQRDKLRRPIMRVSCPGCFGTMILEEPTSETCIGCGLTWKI